MKKTNLINIVAIAFASSVLLTACGGSSNTIEEITETTSVSDTSVDSSTATNTDTTTTVNSSELSTAEIKGLLFMREEEELARDLYLDIYAAKDSRLNIFKNISDNAETQHAEAVRLLLVKYGIDDPSTGEHNTYTNIEIQNLYNQLLNIAVGSDDLAALMVGALVEETDIEDLNIQINLISAEHQDIIQTYEYLLCGSRNHLRSFAKSIENTTGVSYQPQLAAIDTEIRAILDSTQEQCVF